MSRVKTVTATEQGLIFLDKDANVVENAHYLEAVPAEQAFKGLRQEITQRGERTRESLTLLMIALDTERMQGYRGKTKAGARIDKIVKNAMREAEDAQFRPRFLETLPKKLTDDERNAEWDQWIKGLREPGIYARVRGVALRYFVQHGRLPCAYDEAGNAVKDKLLAVSMMENLMTIAAAAAPHEQQDRTIGGAVGDLVNRLSKEKDKLDTAALDVIIGRAEQLIASAKAIKDDKARKATEARAIAPQGMLTKELQEEQKVIAESLAPPAKAKAKGQKREAVTQ